MTMSPIMTYMTMFLAFSRLLGSEPLTIYVIPAKSITSPETIVAAYLIRSYITVKGTIISWKSASVAAAASVASINNIASGINLFGLVGYGFCAIVILFLALFCLGILV